MGTPEVGDLLAISWFVRAPYPRRADLSIAPRIARIIAIEPGRVQVEDDAAERHWLAGPRLEEAVEDDATPRWITQGAVPAWAVGQAVTLHWLERNATQPKVRRDDIVGHVIAGTGESVTVRLPSDGTVEISRANGHQLGVSRQAPRWVAGFGEGG